MSKEYELNQMEKPKKTENICGCGCGCMDSNGKNLDPQSTNEEHELSQNK